MRGGARYNARMKKAGYLWALLFGACVLTAHAEPPEADPAPASDPEVSASLPFTESLLQRAASHVDGLLNSSLQYLGIPYRFGGTTAENGFDCSGLIRRVFKDALGLDLPRTAREMAGRGERISRSELKPGDLVFFHTMRSAFSHVGIYIGDNQFVHSPSKGGRVRIEDMDTAYWRSRFNGARRLVDETKQAAISDSSLH